MNKQEAIREAAEAVVAHGGPDCLTDPRAVLGLMHAAYDAGATPDEIGAEIRRIRDETPR